MDMSSGSTTVPVIYKGAMTDPTHTAPYGTSFRRSCNLVPGQEVPNRLFYVGSAFSSVIEHYGESMTLYSKIGLKS